MGLLHIFHRALSKDAVLSARCELIIPGQRDPTYSIYNTPGPSNQLTIP